MGMQAEMKSTNGTTGREPKPNVNMYIAIGTAMMGALMFGIDCGNFGAVQGFRSFQEAWCVGNFGDEFTCAADASHGAPVNARWLEDFLQPGTVLYTLGAALGGLLLGPVISNNIGRRQCISSGAGISFLGCLLTSFLTFNSVLVFISGRFVTGFGVGVCCFALPLYNSEVSTPSIRGVTGSLFQLNCVIGGMIASVVTYVNRDWRVGMLLPGLVGLLVMLAVWLMPESPRYVMAKRGYKEGVAALSKFRIGDTALEAQKIHAQLVEKEAAGQIVFGDMLRDSSLFKRVFIACALQFAQQFTGFNVIVNYSSTLFAEMGFDNPLLINMAFNFGKLIGIIGGIILLDSKIGGRRVQLMCVTTIVGPAMALSGFGSLMSWPQAVQLLLIIVIALSWEHAWGMIPWVYPSELFSMAERDRATSLAVFTQYTSNALLNALTPVLFSRITVSGTLFFFGAFNVLNFFFVFTFIKETKGVPLEAVPALFGARNCEISAKESA